MCSQVQGAGGHVAKDQITNPNFKNMKTIPNRSPNEVLQLWLTNTVGHLLVKNNNGEGRGVGGLKETRGLLTFFLENDSLLEWGS